MTQNSSTTPAITEFFGARRTIGLRVCGLTLRLPGLRLVLGNPAGHPPLAESISGLGDITYYIGALSAAGAYFVIHLLRRRDPDFSVGLLNGSSDTVAAIEESSPAEEAN